MRRFWTQVDRDFLIAHWGKMPPKEIARKLKRTVSSLYNQTFLLGLCKPVPPVSKQDDATIRRMARQGYCNRCIARTLGGRRNRCTVRRRRRRLGLPDIQSGGSVGTCKSCVFKISETTKRQCREAGVKNLAEVRKVAFQKFARDNGWPETLRPREVQILNVLAARGVPMTRMELAAAIGMRTDRMGANGTLELLGSCNGPGGTYTASLMRQGLVQSIRRAATVHGKGKGRSRDLYLLGPAAMAILEARACQEQTAGSA